MITKKVNRYYCEFCKKANCSAVSIKKHEERCTMNPNRYCGFCHLMEVEQPKMVDLLALLPNPDMSCEYIGDGQVYKSFSTVFQNKVQQTMPELRKATNDCPACIMAALRQKGIPVRLADGFNFTKEGQAIWDEFNTSKAEDYRENYY